MIVGLQLTSDVRVSRLHINNNSQLVVNHINGECHAKEEVLTQYVEKVKSPMIKFIEVYFKHIHRGQNIETYTILVSKPEIFWTTQVSCYSKP